METTHSTDSTKFMVTWNGDDSPVLGYFADYAEAANFASDKSEGDSMGTRMFGPSGKVATYFAGQCSGYLHGTTRKWVSLTVTAWERDESEACEAGTEGCSVLHAAHGGECETW